MAQADFVTRILLENQQFRNQLQDCQQQIRNLRSSSNSASLSINNIRSSLVSMGAKYLAPLAIATAVKEIGTKAIEARSKIESLEVSFTTLLNSSEKASSLVNQLKEYGAKTPYDTEGLAKAAQTMLSFGISYERVLPTLKQLGDVAMGNTDKMQRLALAFSQMSASGKVMKEDLNQMIDAGFNPLSVISKQTGESIGELLDKVSKGEISVEQIAQAFADATAQGGQFHNMAVNMSETVEGKISTLNDAIDETYAAIGKLIEPAVKSSLNGLISIFDGITESVNWLNDAIDDASTKLRQLTFGDSAEEFMAKRGQFLNGNKRAGTYKVGNRYLKNGESYSYNYKAKDGKIHTVTKQLSEGVVKVVSDVIAKTTKKVGTVKVPHRTRVKNNFKQTKQENPEGSIAWYDDQINLKQKQLSVTVNPMDYQKINKELDNLIEEKRFLEIRLKGTNLKDIISEIDTESVNPFSIDMDAINNIKVPQPEISGLVEMSGWLENNQQSVLALTSAFQGLGSAMSQLGAGDTVAMLAQVTAQIASAAMSYVALATAAGTANAMKMPFPANLAAVATVIATVVGIAATVSGYLSGSYAEGGIINGATTHGDQLLARVNAGEMILNGTQQRNLFNMLDNVGATGGIGGQINFKLKGSDLYGSLRNYSNIKAKSGKITGIK